MKVLSSALLAVTLVFGAGNLAAADGHGMDKSNGKGQMNVGQMKDMHPELTIHELKEMYKEHHGTIGAAPSRNFEHHHHHGHNGHAVN
ncbi:hypothetical protein K8O68_01725 [Salipaludibacillus sp. CUR1]|uniref:hypothetical protein n=1 Tax=Salipaludibacillus sp. CUR1 TaxID=2820003 RepID=UPI001E4747C6|nr:hypothetical protein [Salipaludibacillus sp. CUR1]MCE7791135.1 hypothetical protein [Salipaludibacillus sp. CUR1]